MNVALRAPRMTREQFFGWAGHQDGRYEFDGFAPVAMTGGNTRHSRICVNLLVALEMRLRDGPCQVLGPDAGVATIGNRVRYPDAVVSCAETEDAAHVLQGVTVVFEVLSPGSGHVDRIAKVREYRAVPTIRRYVIVEHRKIGATVHARADGEGAWTTTTRADGDLIELPEVGVSFPLCELYRRTTLAKVEAP